MSSEHLANLVKTGQLKIEPSNPSEFKELIRSGQARSCPQKHIYLLFLLQNYTRTFAY